MEALNDSSKLVAQAIHELKDLDDVACEHVISILEEALDKLTNKM